MALVVLALLLLMIFQTIGTVRDRFVLVNERTAQQPTIEQGLKLRASLQTIAGKTAELALAGDSAARDVVDLMHREGITLSPPQKK